MLFTVYLCHYASSRHAEQVLCVRVCLNVCNKFWDDLVLCCLLLCEVFFLYCFSYVIVYWKVTSFSTSLLFTNFLSFFFKWLLWWLSVFKLPFTWFSPLPKPTPNPPSFPSVCSLHFYWPSPHNSAFIIHIGAMATKTTKNSSSRLGIIRFLSASWLSNSAVLCSPLWVKKDGWMDGNMHAAAPLIWMQMYVNNVTSSFVLAIARWWWS